MKNIGIIVKKELTRVFKDKKLVFSMFVLPAILMVAIYGLMGKLTTSMENDIIEHTSTVTIVDASEDVKSFISETQFAKNAEITYMSGADFDKDADALKELIYESEADLIVRFDPDFDSKIKAYAAAGDAIPEIKLMYNNVSNYSQAAYYNFAEVTEGLRAKVQFERLGNMEILSVFSQSEEILVKEEKANGQFLSMILPYMIILMLFAGVMSVVVDAVAGEKERGTMASMLLTPVKRSEIVFGKILSLSILGGLSSLIYAGSMIFSISYMGNSLGEDAAAIGGVTFLPLQIVMLFVIMVTLVFLFVAVLTLLSVIAKDTKTASTLISPVYIVVIVAAMITMFSSGQKADTVRYAIPIYGSSLAIQDICSNELTLAHFGATVGVTVVITLALIVGIVKAFNSEKIMFNA